MELQERDKMILDAVVREYIESVEPVSSLRVREYLDCDLSSATIRLVLCALDKAGFLCQPHISSGRVPTEKAYRFFVDHLMREKESNRHTRAPYDSWEELCRLADEVVSVVEVAVVATGSDSSDPMFRSMSSRLLKQPEFQEEKFMARFSHIFDFDQNDIQKYHDAVTHRTSNVFIGGENPVLDARVGSAFVAHAEVSDVGMCSIVAFSPMRTDYERMYTVFNSLFD